MPAKDNNKTATASRSRLAVCFCDCGQSLTKRLDFLTLAAASGELPGVARVMRCSQLCQAGGFDDLFAAMASQRISRALIAACAPAYYLPCLDKALAKAKVDSHLIGKVNIREHCAWVHPGKGEATEKASRLISAAVRRLRLSEKVDAQHLRLNPQVLVLGGGLTGIQAALSLANKKHKVILATKSQDIGGQALHQNIIPAAARTAAQLVEAVRSSRRITVLTGTELRGLTGQFGQFHARLSDRKLDCGAVVVATGQQYLSGPQQLSELAGIYTCDDLAKLLSRNRLSNLKRIGIILDLKAQQDRAVTRQALRLACCARQRWFCETYVFCRHLRVAGPQQEQEYQQARQAGVVIIKSLDVPQLTQQITAVRIHGIDEQTGREFDLELDLLAVADAQVTNNGQAAITAMLRTGKPVAGFTQQDNVFLLPVDSGRKGIFFAGSCRAAMEWTEALADGQAAAEQAHALLASLSISTPAKKAEVDQAKCAFCLTCYRTCPHGAINMDQANRATIVAPAMCQACGVCVAECPAKAIELVDYIDSQLSITPASPGATIVFACENSALLAADRAGLGRMSYSSEVAIVPLPCAGRLDPVYVLRALRNGAAKVIILGCYDQACKYLHGITRAKARLQRLRNQLTELGLDPDRVQVGSLMATDAGRFISFVDGGLAKVPS